MNPPSADSKTRQLIAKIPEQLADPKNISPHSLDEAEELLEKTNTSFNLVDQYAKQ